MKKFTLLLSLTLVAGVALAQDPQKMEPAKPAKAEVQKVKATEVTGEVVSADATMKTITFKNEKGESTTWPVEGKAVENLKNVKPGEKVTIAYRANEKGEPQAATLIKAAITKAPTTKEPKTPEKQ